MMEQSWELCKENIQPLKRGRMIQDLLASLGPGDGSTAEAVNRKKAEKKSEFEAELRAYKGDDPLDLWSRYINWVEQNYPKGCRDGNLIVLLEKCLKVLHEHANYKDDPRFLDVWIKYCDNTQTSKEIYQQLYSQGYFHCLAEFYVRWADVLEAEGNIKEAEQIYKMALSQEAKPIHSLKEYFTRFQARVASNTIRAMRSARSDDAEPDEESYGRNALNSLKPVGKKAVAPILRVGDHVRGQAGIVPVVSRTPKPSQQCPKPELTVFQDENDLNPDHPLTSGKSFPIQSKLNVENQSKASAWSKVRLSQKTTGVVPLAQTGSTAPTPAFQIHEDEDQAIPPTPQKSVLSNVLKPRKMEPAEEALKNPLLFQEAQDPKTKFMCCLDRIYAGTTEYSFEQLRALEYRQKRPAPPPPVPTQAPPPKVVLTTRVDFLTEDEFNAIPRTIPEPADATKKYMACFAQIYANNTERSLEQIRALRRPVKQAPPSSPKKTFCEIATQTEIAGINVRLLPEIQKSPLREDESLPTRLAPPLEASFQGYLTNACPLVPQEPLKGFLEPKEENQPSREVSFLDKTAEPTVHTKMARNFIDNLFSGSSLMPEPCLKLEHEPFVKPSASHAMKFEVYEDETLARSIQQPISLPSQPAFHIYSDENGENTPAVENAPAHGIKAKRKPLGVVDIPPCSLNSAPKPPQPTFEIFVDPQDQAQMPEKEKKIDEPFKIFADSEVVTKTLGNENQVLLPKTNSLQIFIDPEEGTEEKKVEQNLMDELQKQLKALDGEEEDEDKENEPPANASAPQKRTPLAGILQPALDIATGPPEDVVFEDEEEASVILPTRTDLTDMTNFTLLPPRNMGLFAQGRQISSTPMLTGRGVQPAEGEDCTSNALGLAARNVAPTESESEPKTDNMRQVTEMLPHKLSPIMELSREFRSSSSCTSTSSASSGGSQSNCTQGLLSTLGKSKLEILREDTQTSPAEVYLFPPSKPRPMVEEGRIVEGLVMGEDYDPFTEEVRNCFLEQRKEVWSQKAGFTVAEGSLPAMKPSSLFRAGGFGYKVKKCIGEGAYAKVFVAERDNDLEDVVLKVQVDTGLWEFYICAELRSRLIEHGHDFVADGCMQIEQGIFYNNGNVLVNSYLSKGTLLDVVNAYKMKNTAMPEVLVLYFSCELLYILEGLRVAEIIHGDIKADNIMLQNIPCVEKAMADWSEESVFSYEKSTLKLIDWGRSIDMTFYPPKTSFMNVFTTPDFRCIEMRTGKPWNYQLDYFATVGVIWNMLLSEYMKCDLMRGAWEARGLKRWFKPVWKTVDGTLLNIKSCDELPDLKALRHTLQKAFMEFRPREFRDRVKELENLVNSR